MNNDIRKMRALTAINGVATMLLLIVLMIGFNYTFVKIGAGLHILMFLFSGICWVKLITENDDI
ncbi:MAG: hypothetical protein NC093_07300 [Alistipes sp.]|nr:hypothetical protein [Alistipes sp.]